MKKIMRLFLNMSVAVSVLFLVFSFTLYADDIVIPKLEFDIPPQLIEKITMNSGGGVTVWLPFKKVFSVGPISCTFTMDFWQNGKFEGCELAKDAEMNGIVCAGGAARPFLFDEEGRLARCVLGRDSIVDGIKIKKGSHLTFTKGRLSHIVSDGVWPYEQIINGLKFECGMVKVKNGKLTCSNVSGDDE
jgi:hypothetical protein